MALRYQLKATDKKTSCSGAFIHDDDGNAVSPVFPSALDLYAWMRVQGWQCIEPLEDLDAELSPDDFQVEYVGLPQGRALN